MRHIVPAAILLLAGCSTASAPPAPPPVAAAPPPVVTDNFCETARKRTWSVKDTAQSIAEARAWNRAIDKRCGTAGS